MGISTGFFTRPAKFSTIIADTDLDIGAKSILTTDLSLRQGTTSKFYLMNRIKTAMKTLYLGTLEAQTKIEGNSVSEWTAANGVLVDGLKIKDDKIHEMDGIGGEVMPKIASANLRNSHDAEVDTSSTGATYVKIKTMTFTNGIKGTLTVKFDLKDNPSYVGYGRIYKNGVALGSIQTGTDAWVTESEDLDVGTIAAGETLELWGKAEHASGHVYVRNFRCYYDDDSGTSVMVTS